MTLKGLNLRILMCGSEQSMFNFCKKNKNVGVICFLTHIRKVFFCNAK